MPSIAPIVSPSRLKGLFALTGLALALSACGGGGSSNDTAYTLGGTVSALTGNGLILSDNGTTLSVAPGAATFAFTASVTGSYDVTVLNQPVGQTCSVSNGSGSSNGDAVDTVAVSCRAYALYVADSIGADIAEFTIGSDGTLSAQSLASVTTSSMPSSIAVGSDGLHAWASYLDDETVSNLTIDATGELGLSATASSAATAGYALALSPSGSTLYAANYGGQSVSAFSIGSNGVATALGTAAVAGLAPYALAVTPDGAHVYAANASGDSISGFSAGSTGALTVLTGSAATTSTGSGSKPQGLAVNTAGTILYVTLAGTDKVAAYAIDATTGALTLKTSASTGSTPRGIAVTAGGYAYVANYGDGTVSQFTLAANTLTAASTPTIGAGSHPSQVAISPDSGHAYVTNYGDSTISQYAIGSGGLLSALSPAAVSSNGQGPIGIAVR